VCVVGSGGREHALALALARSAEVVVAPGNPGMATGGAGSDGGAGGGGGLGSVTCAGVPVEEVEADLFVIGPEQPLVEGLADRLRARGQLVLGPGADGARLEGSKAWMKEVLAAAGVRSAAHAVFEGLDAALAHLRSVEPPYVIKTDGLAGGKGVLVTWSLEDAEADLAAKLSGAAFGDAGRRVVIEEGLVGTELSLMVLCDGERLVPLAPAQDFKRLGDRGTGPNTGGMGAYSPVPSVGEHLVDTVIDTAVAPLVAELRRRGIDYRGVLYAGLMLTEDGPAVVEFNIRFGDPEAQVILPRLADATDLADLFAQAAAGNLSDTASFTDDSCVCVVLAAQGYPADPVRGGLIEGLDRAAELRGAQVLHAGTALSPDGSGLLVSAGGRVLNAVGLGPMLADASDNAYRAARCISFPGVQYRRDIAADAIRAEFEELISGRARACNAEMVGGSHTCEDGDW
ncbi:MAG: phosphoribosylamine--glycine ligase, partial [Candidatus Dormibacteria bacterium]